MNKIATFLSEKLAGKLDDLARRDMREWPPTSVPIYYQLQRPQREKQEQTSDSRVIYFKREMTIYEEKVIHPYPLYYYGSRNSRACICCRRK